MAEVVGLAASIITLIELAAKATALSYKYISSVKKAPETLQEFMDELTSLTKVLTTLQDCLKTNPDLTAVQGLEVPLKECIVEMEKLQKKLEPKHGWWRKKLARLKWPLKEGETTEYLERFERFKSLFTLAMNADQLTRSNVIVNSVQGIKKDIQVIKDETESTRQKEEALRIEEKRKKVLYWLYPETFDQKHIEISERRQKGTGQWLLGAPEVQDWINNATSELLLGHGVTGGGKTFLSSLVIDHLRASTKNYGVAFIYFCYKEQDRQKPTHVLASLVKQLACQIRQPLPKEIEDLYDDLEHQQKRPSLEELYSILLVVTKSFGKTFVVCDALDECQAQRKDLLSLFHRMEKDSISLFLTSREHSEDVKQSFQNSAKVKLWAKDGDISSYIEQKIAENPRAERLIKQGNCKDRIISELTDCANGIFLLVHFHIEYLCEQTSVSQILMELENLKNSTSQVNPLDPVYNRAMDTLRKQPKNFVELGLGILSWLVKARRTLTVRELQLAVSMKQDRVIFNEMDLPDKDTLLDVCASLVTIDEKDDTVKLIHYTVQEFLIKNSIIPPDADTNLILATACTTFLSLNIFAQGPCTSNSSLEVRRNLYPFLEYAAQNLSYHLKACNGALTAEVVLRFLRSPGSVSSYLQALHCQKPPITDKVVDYYNRYPKRQTPLHVAATLGHYAATQLLLEDRININVPNDEGKTAMLIATSKGHTSIVQLMLEKDGNPSIADNDGVTTLHMAISKGHGPESMLKLLLDRGADFTVADDRGCTPLHWAASIGCKLEAQLLIERGANIWDADNTGQRAIHFAATKGHESVVQLLLEKGANSDISVTNKSGYTALHMAASEGHVSMIRLLLDKGANLTATANAGGTALHSAACGGNEFAVGILLERGADISATDHRECTPLHRASSSGCESVVRLFLEKGADVSNVDDRRRTALYLAAMKGHVPVVQILLENGGDPSSADNEGTTVLQKAVLNESIVRLLLEKGANISGADHKGCTALHCAASIGLVSVVQLLLERGADVSDTDNTGRRALHFAATKGHKPIVQLLLERGADVSVADNNGQTAEQLATSNGHEFILGLLKPRT